MLKMLYFLIGLYIANISYAMDPDRHAYPDRSLEPYAKQFFGSKTKETTKQKIRDAFGEGSVAEYASICANAKRLLERLKQGADKTSVITAIASTPSRVRESALGLFGMTMEEKAPSFSWISYNFNTLVKDLLSHDPVSVPEIEAFLRGPVGVGLSSSSKLNFIRNIIQASPTVRQNVLTLAGRFLQKQLPEVRDSNSFSSFMVGAGSSCWMQVLAAHAEDIDEESLEYAFEFASSIEQQVDIWAHFRRIAPPNRPGIVRILRELLPYLERGHWRGIGELVPALVLLSEEHRDRLPGFVGSFLEEDKGKSDLLEALTRVCYQEQEELIRAWRGLRVLIPSDKPYFLNHTALHFVGLTSVERKLAYPLLESLLCRDQSGGCLLGDLKKMPAGDREDLLIILRPMVENPGFDSVFQCMSYQTREFWDKEEKYLSSIERGGFEAVMKMVMNIPSPDRMSVVRTLSRIIGTVRGGIGDNYNAERTMREAFNTLASMPRLGRDEIVSETLDLCQRLRDEKGADAEGLHDKLHLAAVLGSLPAPERRHLLLTMERLNSEWCIKKIRDIVKLIEMIRPFSQEAQARFVLVTEKLFPLPLQGYFCRKHELFELAQAMEGVNMDALLASVGTSVTIPLTSVILSEAVNVLTIGSDGSQSLIRPRGGSIKGIPSEEIRRCEGQVDQIIKAISDYIYR